MKNNSYEENFLLGMVAGLLASCQSKTDGYTIEGTLTGDAASGKLIWNVRYTCRIRLW